MMLLGLVGNVVHVHVHVHIQLVLFMSIVLLFSSPSSMRSHHYGVEGLLEEEVGWNDWLIATSGHGIFTKTLVLSDNSTASTATADNSIIITASPPSCYVAGRSMQTGKLLWRTNVCSSPKTTQTKSLQQSHDLSFMWTIDTTGMLRVWKLLQLQKQQQQQQTVTHDDESPSTNTIFTTTTQKPASTMALMWDTPPGEASGGAWVLQQGTTKYMVTTTTTTTTTPEQQHTLCVRNINNGRELATQTSPVPWLSVFSNTHDNNNDEDDDDDEFMALRSDFQLVTFRFLKDDGLLKTVRSVPLSSQNSNDLLDLSTLQITNNNKDQHGLVLSKDGQSITQFDLGSASSPSFKTINIAQWHPLWTTMTELNIIDDHQHLLLKITGHDNRYQPPAVTSAIFRYDPLSQLWDQWYGRTNEDETTQHRDIHYYHNRVVTVTSPNKLTVYSVGDIETTTTTDGQQETLTRGQRHRKYSPLEPLGSVELPTTETIAAVSIVACDDNTGLVSVLITTTGQTTSLLRIDNLVSNTQWSVEDGLQTASVAILLDADDSTTATTATEEEQQQKQQHLLQWSQRLMAPLTLLQQSTAATTSTSATMKKEQHVFGLHKMAVFLSNSLNKVWGIPTSQRGLKTAWTLDLSSTTTSSSSTNHVLVHGTANANAIVHGINGGTNSHEFLVLSMTDTQVHWHCVDGTSGTVHAKGSTNTMASPIAQIIPVFGEDASCRQAAVLLHKDRSVSIVPQDSTGIVMAQLQSTKNGFHTHYVDRELGILESYQIVTSDTSESGFETQVVGQSSFVGETVLGVSYPQRDEAVQSPSAILGDDSLLLKYLNPHIAVIITTTGPPALTTAQDSSALFKALSSIKGSKKDSVAGKRKPKGASKPGDAATDASAQAVSEDIPNLFVNVVDTVSGRILYRVSHTNAVVDKPVPAVITENWIIYAFMNQKSARTELGVLTLYEGMIDKAGLTAFKTPGQTLSFSSLDSRESKPIVLPKTYTIVKPVTALGVSSTRGGISTRQLLIASGDNRLTAIKRALLEPRRPTGDVKEHEKQEGLYQYTPLVPLISMTSPSYNQTVEGVSSIIAAPAALESSSLMLAYGGPDIFFTRLTPSKGFDMLPESFNRPLLSIVVVGLLVAVFVVRNMSSSKTVKMGWVS